jgi:4-amino-4-deoxy-L-arabinose transferase-like glycosyltransferase
MVSDDGWYGPLVTYMPGFPALLALLGSAGVEILSAARLVQAGLFAVNVALIGSLIWLQTGRSLFAGLLGGAIFCASPVALEIHTCALSEPLFIALLLASVGALASAMKGRGLGMTIAAGAFLGCAYLTRYAALPFIGSSVLAILIFFPGTWKRRLGHAAMLSLVCALFVVPWMIRIHRLNVAAIGRPMALHPITAQQFHIGFATLLEWLAPTDFGSVALSLIAYAVAVVAGILLWAKLRNSQAEEQQFQARCLLRLINVMGDCLSAVFDCFDIIL